MFTMTKDVAGVIQQAQVISASEEMTSRIGKVLGQSLQPGAILALSGDLGAGKTRLVQAIATSLGVPTEQVNSPTFTLVQEYEGTFPIRHCDTYRLRDVDEFLDLGLDELLAPDGIAIIEWAERVHHLLPKDILIIAIQILSPTSRQFDFMARGRFSASVLARFVELIGPHK